MATSRGYERAYGSACSHRPKPSEYWAIMGCIWARAWRTASKAGSQRIGNCARSVFESKWISEGEEG